MFQLHNKSFQTYSDDNHHSYMSCLFSDPPKINHRICGNDITNEKTLIFSQEVLLPPPTIAPQASVAGFRVTRRGTIPPKVSFTDGLIGGAMERRMYPMIRYLLWWLEHPSSSHTLDRWRGRRISWLPPLPPTPSRIFGGSDDRHDIKEWRLSSEYLGMYVDCISASDLWRIR